MIKTPVLIVGGGPVELATAIELGWQGVECLLVEQGDGTTDFPLAGAAVWLKQTGGKVEELRIALTAVNPYPQRVTGLDKFTGAALDDAALDEIRELVRKQARPMRTTTVKP